MTYAQYAKIEAVDFNNFVGNAATPSTTVNALNTVWGTGFGNAGYGQTSIPQVAAGNRVSFNDWANLVNTTTTIANQQNTTILPVTAPVQGATISYVSQVSTNLSSIYSNRLNASSQGSTVSSTYTSNFTWSNALTVTLTATFNSSDAARYFFNAGGQLILTFGHPTGSGINALFSQLAAACGSIVLSAPTSGTVSIAGTNYSGVTKIGGSGSPATLLNNVGYYGLTTTNQEIFKQLGSGTPSGYINSFISVNVRGSGTSGLNGDRGSVITFTVVFDEVPNGLLVSLGTTATLTARYPSMSYLSNSWGTVTIGTSGTGT